MAEADSAVVTSLLRRWRGGDQSALDELLPQVYGELRRLAGREFARESAGHTLQPTALINEALLRLVNADVSWQDRCHFQAMMTTTMRRVLVDHARARQREKRGGDQQFVTLVTQAAVAPDQAIDVLVLHEALESLAEQDARKAQLLELYYFGGLSYAELAESLAISEATVHRELRFSRAWLRNHLEAG